MFKQKQPNFKRIDFAISVAIILVLASMAVPSYSHYVLESRRADGIAELSRVMQREETLLKEQGSYSLSMKALGFTTHDNGLVSEEGHYRVEARRCSEPELPIKGCIELIAHPQGAQVADGWLSLSSQGLKNWQMNLPGKFGWP